MAGAPANEILAMFTGRSRLRGSLEIVKGYWANQHKALLDFDVWWRRSVHDGVIANSALPVKTLSAKAGALKPAAAADAAKLEVVFRPDAAVYDGRFANNGWLQEMPRPVTKITWDNAAMISPDTAHKLDVDTGQMLKLSYQGHSLHAPVLIQPGVADNSITLHLGYGRTKAGHTGTGVGFNAYGLRTAAALWHDSGLEAQKADGSYLFASQQMQHVLDTRRDVIQSGTLADYIKNPESVHELYDHIPAENPPNELTMYPDWKYPGYSWGMSLDLNACTGCSACIVACQAENNIAVVGKDQVRRGRLMQWIRVDSYYTGDINKPEIYNQPVPCQQCEDAPCEPGLPAGHQPQRRRPERHGL